MSHQKERKEKNCLNCGVTVIGRYCHQCGQENLEPKESVWYLFLHFFNDITHFDGKFFVTLKDLLFKPGFLSREYMLGKRTSYLNPVRLYIFTSAFFFLIFTFFQNQGDNATSINGKTLKEIDNMDSASFAAFTTNINKGDNRPATPMTRQEYQVFLDTTLGKGFFLGNSYKSKSEYDSLNAKKDGWLKKQLVYKEIEINKKYDWNRHLVSEAFSEALSHGVPQMLFISLPFMALLLKLLYIRRKQYYYVSHGVFALHLYVFGFIALLVFLVIRAINAHLHWTALSILNFLILASVFIYQYIAMKRFYLQGWVKTSIKFLLTNILFIFISALLVVLLIVSSIYKL